MSDLMQKYPIRTISVRQHPYLMYLNQIRVIPVSTLYYRGNIKLLDGYGRFVSIVGTRTPTEWGVSTGKKLGKYFAEHGCTITSGLCIGCDIAGHEGALAVGGKTIAFVGNSLEDSRFGDRNQNSLEVATAILKGNGLIMSMVENGDANRDTYFARNRIVATSLVSIPIQAAERCGTLNEINQARKLDRRVLFPEPMKAEYYNNMLGLYRREIGKDLEGKFKPDLVKKTMRFNGAELPIVLEILKVAEKEQLSAVQLATTRR